MPRYTAIVQKPYCCVPACLAMVLDRRRIRHGSQDEIGYALGLMVPKSSARFFTRVRTGTKLPAGYGTQVEKRQYSLNHYFTTQRIPLTERYFPVEKVGDARKFVASNLKLGSDLIACFNHRELYGSGNWGHTALIEGMRGAMVTLVDPDAAGRQRKKVGLGRLLRAMDRHGEKRHGGFWRISKK